MEQERIERCKELQRRVHAEIERETEERIKNNPKPTEEEIFVGAFREMIEPQVRDAIFEMHRKGYASESSGFGGEHAEIQAIDGYFTLDEKTKAEIESVGAEVLQEDDIMSLGKHEGKYTSIHFTPVEPDIEKMRAAWSRITAALPDKGGPAGPSLSGGGEEFRRKYAPERTDVEKASLEKNLATSTFHPDTERAMRKRLEELGRRK